MDTMFESLSAVAEDMIRLALTLGKAISPMEIRVRENMARQILTTWATGAAAAQPAATPEFSLNFDAEYDRLEELITELSHAVPVIA